MAIVEGYTYDEGLEGLPPPPYSHPPWGDDGVVKKKVVMPHTKPAKLSGFVSLWHDAVDEWNEMSGDERAVWEAKAALDDLAPFVFFIRAYLQHAFHGWGWPPTWSDYGRGYVLRVHCRLAVPADGFFWFREGEPATGAHTIQAKVSHACTGQVHPTAQIPEWAPNPYLQVGIWEKYPDGEVMWPGTRQITSFPAPWAQVSSPERETDADLESLELEIEGWAVMGHHYFDDFQLLVDGVNVMENPHLNYWWLDWLDEVLGSGVGRIGKTFDQIYASPTIWEIGL